MIFVEDEDATKYLETLAHYKKSSYGIYAYCPMSNHIHTLWLLGQVLCYSYRLIIVLSVILYPFFLQLGDVSICKNADFISVV